MVILPLLKDVIKREQEPNAKKKYSRKAKNLTVTTSTNSKDIFKKLTWSGKWLIFAAFITIGFSIWAKIRDDKQRIINELNLSTTISKYEDELKKLRLTIDTLSNDPSEKVSEGFSLSSILQIGDILDRRKKFIFDCGESMEINRLSLYLDYDNNLVFTVIDNSGVTYSVRAVPNFVSFKDNASYFLHCDIGFSKEFSFIRIFLDDRLVGIQTFNNRISGEKLNMNNFHIGSDMSGNYPGEFMVSSTIVWKKVLNRKEIMGVMNNLVQ